MDQWRQISQQTAASQQPQPRSSAGSAVNNPLPGTHSDCVPAAARPLHVRPQASCNAPACVASSAEASMMPSGMLGGARSPKAAPAVPLHGAENPPLSGTKRSAASLADGADDKPLPSSYCQQEQSEPAASTPQHPASAPQHPSAPPMASGATFGDFMWQSQGSMIGRGTADDLQLDDDD